MLMLSTSLMSCSTRVVVVHDNDLLRVGPNIVGDAYVWDKTTKSWTLVHHVSYPEGWYMTGYNNK
jgi:hypothetical protein